MTLPAQVRGFLIDLDGTVTEAQKLVPGVPEVVFPAGQENSLPAGHQYYQQASLSDSDQIAKPRLGSSARYHHHRAGGWA